MQVKVRATDDSANLGAVTTASMTVGKRTCPCSIFTETELPVVEASTDARAIELGVKFRAALDGYASGVRFYKGPGNSGTHTGSLWTASGQLLSTATFTAESVSGWQQVDFSTPVGVKAGTTYVASYHTDTGRYSATNGFFAASGTHLEPLDALKSGVDGSNGVYRLGASAFPNVSFGSTNYWVDVVYQDDPSPSVVSRTPVPDAGSVGLSTAVSVTFNKPIRTADLEFTLKQPDGSAIAASIALDATGTTATLRPSVPLVAGTRHSASVMAADVGGNAMPSPATWSFRTGTPQNAPGICPCTLFSDLVTPATSASTDAKAIEVGMRFTPASDGVVSALRFYKGPGNDGAHTGNLWSSSGALLGSAVFSAESATGWQTVTLPAPVTLTAGNGYVVSYHTTSGRYAVTGGTFKTAGVSYGPLSAPASTTAAGNGVYRYGASGFPTSSFNGSNYWVDVVFQDTAAAKVTTRTPISDAGTVALGTGVTATFNKTVQPSSVTLVLRDPSGGTVAGTNSYDEATRTVSLLPAAPLQPGTSYTASAAAIDMAGTPSEPATWSFTTGFPQAAPGSCPCSLWSDFRTPTIASVADARPIEVGVKFRATTAGRVTGVRFYKGAANTGSHTGSLWSAAGALLARGTFTAESASGWQMLTFAEPVAVAPGTTYVASYHAPVGRHSASAAFFGSTSTYGPLSALRNGLDGLNGVYTYGTGSFPTSGYNSTNYWVDVVFVPAA
jgi:methionine-rich copper-binding protein CopC